MRLQTTALLVLLLTVLTSAAPLSVESQKPPSILTPSNSTTSGDSQTSSSNVPLPTGHKQTQESSLKLNGPEFPFVHSIIPSAASPDSDLPFIHNKQKPVNSDLPWVFIYKRDVTKRGLPFTHSAQSSVFPYGLNQESDIPPSSSDVSLPTVHDKTQKSSNSDFPVGYGVPSSSDSEFPYIFSEQKPAESNIPYGYKKRDAQPDLPTPDSSELSYIPDAKSQPADSAFPYVV